MSRALYFIFMTMLIGFYYLEGKPFWVGLYSGMMLSVVIVIIQNWRTNRLRVKMAEHINLQFTEHNDRLMATLQIDTVSDEELEGLK